jgi:hypothetical protein
MDWDSALNVPAAPYSYLPATRRDIVGTFWDWLSLGLAADAQVRL